MKKILRFRKAPCISDTWLLMSYRVDVCWDGVWIYIGSLHKIPKNPEPGDRSYQWHWSFSAPIAMHMGTSGEVNEPLYVSKRVITRQFLEGLRYFGSYLNERVKEKCNES